MALLATVRRMGGLEGLDAAVERMRAGDREAVGDVYRTLAPHLRAWLRTQVQHGEIADDLAETTFVELVRATNVEFADGAAVRAWLFRAGRNNLIDWRRRAARRGDHQLTQEVAEAQPDRDLGPEHAVVQQDAVAEVLDAMQELSPDQQEVLRLRLLGQLSGLEVAELTGRTEGAVRALQHRGLRSLGRIIEGRRDEDRDHP
ncbi:MAG TPA: RNA polymerase sigma factor [Nitriliruptorales bacterium]